jgi:maltooligosyltrehalose trehalohydrolase
MFFMGDEWGARTPWQFFSDHGPELGGAVSAGRRREFAAHGWSAQDIPDPQDRATFEASKLDWAEAETPPAQALMEWNRQLIALRRSEPALADPRLGTAQFDYDEQAHWFVARRGDISVAVNLAPVAQAVPVAGDVLLASAAVAIGPGSQVLAGESVAVLRTR